MKRKEFSAKKNDIKLVEIKYTEPLTIEHVNNKIISNGVKL